MIERNCKRCGAEFFANLARIKKGEALYCSRACSNKNNAIKGDGCWNYKGSNTYGAIHDWLNDTFAKPVYCENCGLVGVRMNGRWNIQWALKSGLKYERKIENFLWLCSPCHIEYDGTAVKGGWNKGKSWSIEVRKKISEGTKLGMAKLK